MAGNVLEYVSPSRTGLVANSTISIFSQEMLGPEMLGYGAATVNSTTTTADSVFIHPLILPHPFLVNQFFWVNGAAVNGTTDIGVYTEDGQTKLVSAGATSNSGTSAIQLVNVTDYILPPNTRLWLVIGASSATQQYTRIQLTAPAADFVCCKTMASALSAGVLPSAITFAIAANTAIWCGMTGLATL